MKLHDQSDTRHTRRSCIACIELQSAIPTRARAFVLSAGTLTSQLLHHQALETSLTASALAAAAADFTLARQLLQTVSR
jgi:hypothetical protein